jgi:hypothetical protein
MNAEMERALSMARAHDLARERAQGLRDEAVARLWSRIEDALARSAQGASRSARRLWARLQRHRGAAPMAGCYNAASRS